MIDLGTVNSATGGSAQTWQGILANNTGKTRIYNAVTIKPTDSLKIIFEGRG